MTACYTMCEIIDDPGYHPNVSLFFSPHRLEGGYIVIMSRLHEEGLQTDLPLYTE